MPQKSTRSCFVRLVPLTCLLIVAARLTQAQAQQYQDVGDEQQPAARNTRMRRQQQGAGRVQLPQSPVDSSLAAPAQTQPGVNLQSGVQTGVMAVSSSMDAQPPRVGGVGANTQARLPKVDGVSPQAQAPQPPSIDGQPEMLRPMRKRRPRVRPTKPMYDDAYAEAEADDGDDYHEQPERRRGSIRRDENQDEYCDDDDDDDHDDYGHLFRPIRHMTRMMGSVMNQMQGMASNGFSGKIPMGSNMAMAQSMSDSDGYSRLSSLVKNNGRTRGLVSETRNGRTQTRRIGDEDGEEDEE